MIRYTLLSLIVLATYGCASGPTYRSDHDVNADFTRYQTYGWVEELATEKAGYSTLITGHFKDAISREMDALGYRYTETNPDLLVNFSANVQEIVDVRSRQSPSVSMGIGMGGYYGYRTGIYGTFPLYQPEVETVRYQEGTANVDVIDAAQRRLVWEGIAEGRLTEKAMQNPRESISRVVAGMYERFPGAQN